jgi:hypothetical protein
MEKGTKVLKLQIGNRWIKRIWVSNMAIAF